MFILLIHSRTQSGNDLKKALSSICSTFLEAANPAIAIERDLVWKADLVLMENTDAAVDLCKSVRRSSTNPLLPILALSPTGDVAREVAILEAGADAVFADSVHPDALRAAVHSALRRQAAISAMDETETVLFTLAQSVEERDPALGLHCSRLAFMAAGMGSALGLDACDILALQRGGYLHDIGKVAIPDNVLFKAGPLTEDEWTIMKSHTTRGERICRNVRSLSSVLPIIRSHHERWDGTGYPDRLQGEDIPLVARIIQLADIYDALTTERPYKQAFSPKEAVRIIEEETSRGWRDPHLTKIFIDLLPLFESSETTEFSQLSLQSLATSMRQYRGALVHPPASHLLAGGL